MCHQHKVVKRNNDFVLTCHFLPILEVKSFFEYDMRIYLEIYCDIESRYKNLIINIPNCFIQDNVINAI